jgi:two-component system, cell cycle response regulator
MSDDGRVLNERSAAVDQLGMAQARIILVDTSEASREVMVRRLTAQGYQVEAAADPVTGAELALSAPPAAVIADFWMPSISGIQLCRLLRTEPATADVPVILRGDDDPRNRFWSERAGAVGYVRKGRMSELVRMLAKSVAQAEPSDGFFIQLGGGAIDIRERIARYLDQALFESVIAAEVRSLSACGSFERLFDSFAQLLAQVTHYRWLALGLSTPPLFALHHHPSNAELAEREARAALGVPAEVPALCVIDEDPNAEQAGPGVVVRSVLFGGVEIGRLALALSASSERDAEQHLVALVAGELGGPVRIATLMDEQKRLATIDPLTSLKNRRSFIEQAHIEIARCQRYDLPLSLALLDVDHFKSINDTRGHAAGDEVLASLGTLLTSQLRTCDLAARWGGEEFVVLLPNTTQAAGTLLAERLRAAIETLDIYYDGHPIHVTASVGVAELLAGESPDGLVDRADRAMYAAKVGGRNRVSAAELPCPTSVPRSTAPRIES